MFGAQASADFSEGFSRSNPPSPTSSQGGSFSSGHSVTSFPPISPHTPEGRSPSDSNPRAALSRSHSSDSLDSEGSLSEEFSPLPATPRESSPLLAAARARRSSSPDVPAIETAATTSHNRGMKALKFSMAFFGILALTSGALLLANRLKALSLNPTQMKALIGTTVAGGSLVAIELLVLITLNRRESRPESDESKTTTSKQDESTTEVTPTTGDGRTSAAAALPASMDIDE